MFVWVVAICLLSGYYLDRRYSKQRSTSHVPRVPEVPQANLPDRIEAVLNAAQGQLHSAENHAAALDLLQKRHDHKEQNWEDLGADMICRLQQLQRSYDESQEEVGSLDRKYRTEVSSLERKYRTEQRAHRETQMRLNSQEMFAKRNKNALQEDAWRKVDTTSCQLEQMAQAKDALAQELSTAHQQIALAQKAAAAALQPEQHLDAQLKQHTAQRLSVTHLIDAIKSKDWNIQALSGQCCTTNAGCECHNPSCLQPTLTKQQQASVTVTDVEALVHAAGKLLESSRRAVLATEDAALQRMEVTVRQYFQEHQADGVVRILGYDTLEADVHAAAKMCLKAALEAKMAGTGFCSTDDLQQLLHNVFVQWVVHLKVLGSPEQVHRVLYDACCRGRGVLDCVLQIQQANECSGRAEQSYVAAHRQAAPLYASSSSHHGFSSEISAPVAASPAAYTPTRSARAQSPVPVTPPRTATIRLPTTNRPQPHSVSADGSEALGSRGGRMHLNRNGNWARSASQPHQARNGPNGEPAYTDADRRTGVGERGGRKSLNSKGNWVYDSSRKKK